MGAPLTPLGRKPLTSSLRSPPGKPAPPSCDWRKAGAVTCPSDQRTCGSCWAFAAVANVESLWFIHFKKLYKLSVQEVLDCSGFKDACEGGYPWNAFGTIYRLGVSTAMSYPYEAQQGTCRSNQDNVVVRIQGFQTLPSNESQLAAHVATRGPITVIMNSRLLQHYRGGIITKHLASSCHPDLLNHVVLIVGYGQEKRIPYWIVKNSHGSDCGEEGYFRIYRGGNACGIAEIPVTATVGQDGDGSTAHPDHCPA
ncbi:cathepsin W-like [Alligator sinensis]|uniref:Cathepsin W-like n=1 Tax=Alligator sinensis TaxID=38654 RepID=A0A3Q0HCM2_ALLSI|nr:cathepsin W-like [Alligator sinensis]